MGANGNKKKARFSLIENSEGRLLCCCRQELPHDNSMKICLHGETKQLQTKPFENRPHGPLLELNKLNNYDLVQGQSSLIGRKCSI